MAVWLEQVLNSIFDVTGGRVVTTRTPVISHEMTRAAATTAYAAGQTLLNAAGTLSELAGAGRINGGTGIIVGLRISTNNKAFFPRLRIHLFNASDPTFAADYSSWKELYADSGKRVGYYDMPALTVAADSALSDMTRTLDYTVRLPFQCAAASTSLWYAYEVLDAATPANGQKFTLTVNLMQD